MAEQFDPNQPFEPAQPEAAGFDPNADFEPIGPAFDPNAKFEPVGEPDMKNVEEGIKANFAKHEAAKAEKKLASGSGPELLHPEAPKMKEAQSFIEALEAGFDMSVSGLMKQRPDMQLAENAPMHYRIASGIATMAGDVPAMLGGAFVGGAAGGAAGTVTLPVVGTVGLGVAGAAYGSFALPEGMRTWMMEGYEKGEMKSFSDFWERSSATFISQLKGGTIGVATAGAGGVVAKTAGKIAAPAAVKTTAQLTTEVATMTTIGAALDGRVPEPHEFIDGAAMVGLMHGTMRVTKGPAAKAATKLRTMYAKMGTTPIEVVEQAQRSPKLKQEILADNVPVPGGRGEFGITVAEPKPPENFPVTKPLRKAKAENTPEMNAILSKVKEARDPTLGEKAKAAFKETVDTLTDRDKAYTAFVDKLDPINRATAILTKNKDVLLAEDNPYILSRTSVDHLSKARHFFEKGTLDFKGLEKKGASLRSTLESVDNIEHLEGYMISKRVLEKEAQFAAERKAKGQPAFDHDAYYKLDDANRAMVKAATPELKLTGFNPKEAKAVVEQHAAKYEAAAKRVTEFSNQVLEYVHEAGIINKEQLARMMEANKDYVPFKRVLEDAEKAGGAKRGKAGSLKEFTGSERGIESPIMSIVENTAELIRMAEINRPKEALVKLAEAHPGQELIREVKKPMEKVTVPKEEVARQLGISLEEAEVVTTFKPRNKDLTATQFEVYRDGKRKIYETTPELAEAIKSLGGDATATNALFKIANGFTTVKKIAITFTPDFIVRNFERDFLTAQVFSKSKSINPLDVLSAIGDIWKKNDTYYSWLKSGGANGAFLDLNAKYVKTDIYRMQRETNFMNSVRNLVSKPVDFMRVGSELAEQSLRVAEFKKRRQAGEGIIGSGFASREITLDFQRVGAKVSAWNAATAFMNVQIQGLDKSVRAFKANPAGMPIRATAYITVPSLLLYWANYGDERVKQVPQWEKDHFWIFAFDDWQEVDPQEADQLPDYMVREENGKVLINKGNLYRLPKPQELGLLFGSLPERVMDAYFGENPNAFKHFGESVQKLIVPSVMPDMVAPAVEQYFNQSFFTGRDIVPHHLQGVLPEYQFVEYTSEVAKGLGKLVATVDRHNDFASPMVIDNYIRSWGGTLGQYAVQAADKALQKTGVVPDNVDPTMTLSDIWFIKSFAVRYPQAGAQSIQDFHDSYIENKEVIDTIRHLAKEGDFDSMEKELVLEANQDNLVKLDGIREALANQSNFIRLVHKNPEMSADEKRQMIDGAYLMMTEIAKHGNEVMQEIKSQVNDKGE